VHQPNVSFFFNLPENISLVSMILLWSVDVVLVAYLEYKSGLPLGDIE
jgi:hypothetical protein